MRLWNAILAGLQVLSAGTVLGDMINPKYAAMFSLLVAAAHAGTAYYMKSDQAKPAESHEEP